MHALTASRSRSGCVSSPRLRRHSVDEAPADEACDLDSKDQLCSYNPAEIDARFEDEPIAVAGRVATVALAAGRIKLADDDGATLRAELASGDNALSATGDYREIDVYVKRQQQALYKKFFADEARVGRQFGRLLACEAARASLRVAEFLRAQQVDSAQFGVAQLTEAAFVTRAPLALGGSRHSGGATEPVGVLPGTSWWP